ncbi:MAG: hypothetical protein NVS2B7_39050 [Herpetosiphon sp.]
MLVPEQHDSIAPPASARSGSVEASDKLQHYELIVEHSSDMVCLLDRDGNFVYASPSYRALLGYDPAELIGQSGFLHLHPDDQESIAVQWGAVLAHGHGHATFRFRAADGSWHRLEAHSSLTTSGGTEYAVVVSHDVTARYEAETALRESEERYRSLVTATAQIVWTTAADGQVIELPMWQAFTGQSSEEVAGYKWLNAVHPADRERTEQVWRAAVDSRSEYSVEYRVRRNDGVYRWFLSRGVPVLEADGSIREWVGTCTDIHDRRVAADYRRLLDDVTMTLASSLEYETMLQDVAHRCVPVLADACHISLLTKNNEIQWLIDHPLSPTAALIKDIRNLDPLNSQSNSPVVQAIRSGKTMCFAEVSEAQLRAMARDDEHLALLHKLAPRSLLVVPMHARERILGAVAFVSTSADRHYSEMEQQLAEELARRAALAVDNAYLLRETQQALQSRDEFLSLASHELKTPISAIIGYAQLLERRLTRQAANDHQTMRTLQTLVEQGHRLTRLIHDMMDVSRMQLEQLHMQRKTVDLVALTNRLVAEVAPVAPSYHFEIETDASPLEVLGDPDRLEQALQNLVQNAMKYSPKESIIKIRVERRGNQAAVLVGDQGIGIPKADQPLVFTRFFRASNAISTAANGMGVGLYVVKEIVAQHGGTVSVESIENVGSTFTVTLPLMIATP